MYFCGSQFQGNPQILVCENGVSGVWGVLTDPDKAAGPSEACLLRERLKRSPVRGRTFLYRQEVESLMLP